MYVSKYVRKLLTTHKKKNLKTSSGDQLAWHLLRLLFERFLIFVWSIKPWSTGTLINNPNPK